jgi:hypothetical protein
VVPARSACDTLKLIEAEEESARTGKELTIDS